ncbi:leucine--tRNA ligase [Patescibacteria group bacterium]|nr:leucine--tRNA ligase [Patescibacteria group bacterium]
MFYNHQKIEKKWQKIWEKEKIYEPNFKKAKRPFYNLMMFPYPSAEGLHVGNMYAFTGSDIYGRFKRMRGYDVFEPIGLDGFGIHSENYALKIGVHPSKQAKISEKHFYKQLKMIGNGFSWDEKLETYDPEYYKWTQWIFIQLFKRGLAYRKKQAVNWCPSCKTVLADEQVIAEKCERCSSEVIKKNLEQWFFKITKYAERLLKNLDMIDWSERTKIAQKEWIGRSEGINLKEKVKNLNIEFEVFDTIPQTFLAQTFTVIAPEHPLVERLITGTKYEKSVREFVEKIKQKKAVNKFDVEKESEGIFTGRYVDNPFGTGDLPIWVASYVIAGYGTGIVNCSAHDERDFAFAKKYNIPLKVVMLPLDVDLAKKVQNFEICYHHASDGIIQEPIEMKGMTWEKARKPIIEYIEKKGFGKKTINYHLRDWLISRQRYWGPPIPLVFCENCAERIKNKELGIKNKKFDKGEIENPGWIPVPEKDLPVILPYIKDFQPKGTGESPLATDKKFYEVKCPECGKMARRETDVSDTFLDSAWYYLGYFFENWKATLRGVRQKASREIENSPFSSPLIRKWLPVDMYIGGQEHACLHLLYSRFLAMVFNDLGLIDFEEPFKKFRAHGLLTKDGAKMSKSRGNVVNPDEYIKKFGADVFRMYLMFLSPFERGGDFQSKGILGIARFLDRIFNFGNSFANRKVGEKQTLNKFENKKELEKLFHQTIKKITEDIENLNYNTAISALMILFNKMEKESQLSIVNCQLFLKLLAPFAPFISEELWAKLGHKKSIHLEKWPEYNSRLLKQKKIILIVQVNGKFRDKIEVNVDISEQEAKEIILSREKIQKYTKGKEIKKIIFVPGKLFNIVI